MDDRALGEQLVAGRIITPEQLDKCLAIQQDLASMGVVRALDEILKDHNMIGAGRAQPLATVPPNSLRRVKCRHCGNRVLVQPGQHEREVVCKQCGANAVTEPRSHSGRTSAADATRDRGGAVDFEPTLPTLELLGGGPRAADGELNLELPAITPVSEYSGDETPSGEEPTNRTLPLYVGPQKGLGSRQGSRAEASDVREVMGGREPVRAPDAGRRRESSGVAAIRSTRGGPAARRRRTGSGSNPAHGSAERSSKTLGLVLVACTLLALVTAAVLYSMGREEPPIHPGDPAKPVVKNPPTTPPPVVPPPVVPPPAQTWERELAAYRDAVSKDDERGAFDALLRYISLQPQDGERRRALIELGVKLEEGDSLLPHLEAMIAAGRDRAWALRVASHVHARAGRPGDAIAALEQAVALEPTGELRAHLARAYLEHGQTDKFLEQFAKPDFETPQFEALADLKIAIRSRVSEHLAAAIKSNQLAAQQAAAAHGAKLLRFDPDFWFFHLLHGMLVGSTGRDNAGVIAAMDKAIGLFPRDERDPTFLVTALNYRGWSHFGLRQYDLAIADSRRAIDMCEASMAMPMYTTLLNSVYAQKKAESFRRLLTVYIWCATSYQVPNAGVDQFRQGLKRLTNSEELASPDDACKAAQFFLVVNTDVADSPLVRGDKVLRVAGKPIENTQRVYQAWVDLDAKHDPASRLVLLVERGGREREVVIPSGKLGATSDQFRRGYMQLRIGALD